jgi:hypothetical protein
MYFVGLLILIHEYSFNQSQSRDLHSRLISRSVLAVDDAEAGLIILHIIKLPRMFNWTCIRWDVFAPALFRILYTLSYDRTFYRGREI